ncbi:hypothetical protein ABW20_dc0102094 [Dactylellina cionopaga]|nr:hypothetical protein ABW20_dc0102094 [Dactylellina cionopaga]
MQMLIRNGMKGSGFNLCKLQWAVGFATYRHQQPTNDNLWIAMGQNGGSAMACMWETILADKKVAISKYTDGGGRRVYVDTFGCTEIYRVNAIESRHPSIKSSDYPPAEMDTKAQYRRDSSDNVHVIYPPNFNNKAFEGYVPPRYTEGGLTVAPIPPPAPSPLPEKKIMGMKRRKFWIILIVFILIVLAVAVGAGVGVASATKKKNIGNKK